MHPDLGVENQSTAEYHLSQGPLASALLLCRAGYFCALEAILCSVCLPATLASACQAPATHCPLHHSCNN